jgi:hypothetical protein
VARSARQADPVTDDYVTSLMCDEIASSIERTSQPPRHKRAVGRVGSLSTSSARASCPAPLRCSGSPLRRWATAGRRPLSLNEPATTRDLVQRRRRQGAPKQCSCTSKVRKSRLWHRVQISGERGSEQPTPIGAAPEPHCPSKKPLSLGHLYDPTYDEALLPYEREKSDMRVEKRGSRSRSNARRGRGS